MVVPMGQVTADGTWTRYAIPAAVDAKLSGLLAGSDGAIWFTSQSLETGMVSAKIAQIYASGVLTEFMLPSEDSTVRPQHILTGALAEGPDGAFWFTEIGKIGRLTRLGQFSEYSVPWVPAQPRGITSGPDQAMWFTDMAANVIGRISIVGQITQFPLPKPNAPVGCGVVCPLGITLGPDGMMWFTESQLNAGRIGRLTTGGQLTEYPVPGSSALWQLAAGPDGNIWFTDVRVSSIGRITTEGMVSKYPLPSSNAGGVGSSIVGGPDGAMWFTVSKSQSGDDPYPNLLGRIGMDGRITTYKIPVPSNSGVGGVVAAAAGGGKAIWLIYGARDVWRFVPKS